MEVSGNAPEDLNTIDAGIAGRLQSNPNASVAAETLTKAPHLHGFVVTPSILQDILELHIETEENANPVQSNTVIVRSPARLRANPNRD